MVGSYLERAKGEGTGEMLGISEVRAPGTNVVFVSCFSELSTVCSCTKRTASTASRHYVVITIKQGLLGSNLDSAPSMKDGKDRFDRHDSHLNAGRDKDVNPEYSVKETEDIAERLAKGPGAFIAPKGKHSRMSMVRRDDG